MSPELVADWAMIKAALDRCEAAFDEPCSLSLDPSSSADALAVLAWRETLARRQPVLEHRLINRFAGECTPATFGAKSLARCKVATDADQPRPRPAAEAKITSKFTPGALAQGSRRLMTLLEPGRHTDRR